MTPLRNSYIPSTFHDRLKDLMNSLMIPSSLIWIQEVASRCHCFSKDLMNSLHYTTLHCTLHYHIINDSVLYNVL